MIASKSNVSTLEIHSVTIFTETQTALIVEQIERIESGI